MNKWKKTGDYLDKSIYILPPILMENLREEDFSSSALLLYFTDNQFSDFELDKFFNNLLKSAPLVVHIAGKNADKYLTNILNNRILNENKKHTMTYLTEEHKNIELISNFFYASWPSEERFDEWKDYKIIVIGNKIGLYSKLYSEINKFLK